MPHRPSKILFVGTLLAVLISSLGCSSQSDEASAKGAGGTGGHNPNPTQLAFEPSSTITMVPGDMTELTLRATPPAVYHVRFSLLGDYQDASLDKSETNTDASGKATVAVTAPTAATTFRVKASVSDDVSTETGISVSASGFGTLQVNPIYSGKRSVSYWTASVRAGSTCAELSGSVPSDGDLKGTAPAGQVPQIDGVPVGPALAVTIRGAYSVAGCKDLSDIRAGEINKISVEVSDLPMKLSETDLVVSLGLDAQKSDLTTLLDSTAVLNQFSGSNNDVAALLDAMQQAAPDSTTQTAFQAARTSGAWDQALETALGGPSVAPKAIRNLVAPWLAQGAVSLPGTETFQGRLTAAGQTSGFALLSIDHVATVSADDAGLAGMNLASWQGEPDDTVALGATLFFIPSRLVTALAEPPALKSAPGASDVPDAISMLLSCDTVAQTLVLAGTSPGSYAYENCTQTCVHTMCERGLQIIWQNARDASSNGVAAAASLVIGATGNAGVDDHARPTGFNGSWVGSLNLDTNQNSVGGPASGSKPPPPN